MSRVFQPVLRRSAGLAIAALGIAGVLASSAAAQNEIAFGVRPIYNGVPGAGPNLVYYNLPASGSVYAGAVNTHFDLTALVNGSGTETASAFGLIATVSGTGQVVFNPPAIVNDANNLGGALNPSPSFNTNNSFDIRYANTGIQTGTSREIDIVALEEIALQNNTVTNGDGIASIPIQIGGGVTGTYNVVFDVSPNYTGFVKTIALNNTQFLTNAAALPHVGGTIEVKQSVRGDMNGDSFVDGRDVQGFVDVFLDIGAFQASHPWLQTLYIADFQVNGAVDGGDVQGFVDAFLGIGGSPGPSPAAVPEPSSVVLCSLGFGILMLARRRKSRG